jgi:hypothetical protein
VHDAVADGGERMLGQIRAIGFECLEHRPEPRRMIRDAEGPFAGFVRPTVPDGSDFFADALDKPGRKRLVAAHIDQLVLKRRRAAVDNKDKAHDRAA